MFFLLKFQDFLEKIHRIALGLLIFVLSSLWVVCIRGPEDGTGKRKWEVPMSQCVCVCVCVCVWVRACVPACLLQSNPC